MDDTLFRQEMMLNRSAYQALRDQLRQHYAGQYVALAGGKLVAAAPTYDGAVAAVEHLSPVPEHYLVFPADEEPDFEPFYDY